MFNLLNPILCKNIWKYKLGIFLLSFSSLIFPSLIAPLLPNSVEQVVFSSIAITAQAQDSQESQKSPETAQKKILKIGVIAIRGKDKSLAEWQPHAEYLSSKIPGYDFQIVPLDFDELYPAMDSNQLDFAIVSPGFYIYLEDTYEVNQLVSLKNLRSGKPYTVFGGVIFTLADRNDINDLKDFKGKTFMAVEENSFAGWQTAWGVFHDQGIEPKRDFKELRFGGTQDNVVTAVLKGEVDGGSVRTDTLEQMVAEGKVDLKNLKILNQQQDPEGKFPFIRSTPLYPEWAFAAAKNVPLEIKEEVAKALLDLSADNPAALAAKSGGWTVSLNHRPVHELFIKLKLPPYDQIGEYTTAQLVEGLLIVTVVALLFIGALVIYFQKNSLSKQKLNEQALNQLNKSLEATAEEQRQQKEQQKQAKEDLEAAIYTLIDEIADATDGDLTVRANLNSLELSTVADLFNAIINNLQEIAIEAKQSTSQVGDSLTQNEQAMRILAEQAIAEAKETRNTLISIEHMSQSIQAVAQNANQAEQIVDDTYNTVLHSTENMDSTVDSILNLRTTVRETAKKMQHLGDSSQKISQVVSLIEEIALKTNVLAINAGAEADRAGEYGQGFAIVAEQVGALAEQCTAATKEIAKIVTAIQAETEEVNQAMESGTTQVVETTQLVESTKESLSLVLEKSQAISLLMESISQSTISQASTSQNVTNLMQKIAQLAETTSQSSQKVAQSIVETAQVAAKLQSTVARFKVVD
jgi:methyl-accepting chemotaxis protein PixJ